MNTPSNILEIAFSEIPVHADVDELMKITQEYQYFPVSFGTIVRDEFFCSISPEFKLMQEISTAVQKLEMPLVSCHIQARGDYAARIENGQESPVILERIPALDNISIMPTNPDAAENIIKFAEKCAAKNINTTIISNQKTAPAALAIAKYVIKNEIKIPNLTTEHVGDIIDKEGVALTYWEKFYPIFFNASFGGGINSGNIQRALNNIVHSQPDYKQTRLSIGKGILNECSDVDHTNFEQILCAAEDWLRLQFNTRPQNKANSQPTSGQFMTANEYAKSFREFVNKNPELSRKHLQPDIPFNLRRIPAVEKIASEIFNGLKR